jgi:hypothetical protein
VPTSQSGSSCAPTGCCCANMATGASTVSCTSRSQRSASRSPSPRSWSLARRSCSGRRNSSPRVGASPRLYERAASAWAARSRASAYRTR